MLMQFVYVWKTRQTKGITKAEKTKQEKIKYEQTKQPIYTSKAVLSNRY